MRAAQTLMGSEFAVGVGRTRIVDDCVRARLREGIGFRRKAEPSRAPVLLDLRVVASRDQDRTGNSEAGHRRMHSQFKSRHATQMNIRQQAGGPSESSRPAEFFRRSPKRRAPIAGGAGSRLSRAFSARRHRRRRWRCGLTGVGMNGFADSGARYARRRGAPSCCYPPTGLFLAATVQERREPSRGNSPASTRMHVRHSRSVGRIP